MSSDDEVESRPSVGTKSKRKQYIDFSGSHPEDAVLYGKLPPAGEDEEQPELEEWLDILGSGRLKKKILVEGKPDSRPEFGQEIFLHYKIMVDGDDNVLFDSRINGSQEPTVFRLGENDVVPAWDMACALMNDGEKALLYSDTGYAYGAPGRDDLNIHANANIMFELEIVKFGDGPIDLEDTTPLERAALATKKKERGNELFKRKDWDGASKSYQMGLNIVKHWNEGEDISGKEEELKSVLVTLLNNMCQTQLQYGAYDKAKKTCQEALDVDPNHIKALYRMGMILTHFNEFEEAQRVLHKAQAAEPNNKAVAIAIKKAIEGAAKQTKEEKKLAEAMLRGYSQPQTTEKPATDTYDKPALGAMTSSSNNQNVILWAALIVLLVAFFGAKSWAV